MTEDHYTYWDSTPWIKQKLPLGDYINVILLSERNLHRLSLSISEDHISWQNWLNWLSMTTPTWKYTAAPFLANTNQTSQHLNCSPHKPSPALRWIKDWLTCQPQGMGGQCLMVCPRGWHRGQGNLITSLMSCTQSSPWASLHIGRVMRSASYSRWLCCHPGGLDRLGNWAEKDH